MFTKEECPACTGERVSVLGQIGVEEIIKGYRGNGLKTSVAHLFSSLTPAGISLCRCDICQARWYANSPSGDGAFYEALQQHAWYYQSEKPEYVFAAKWIEAGDRILEVGCGRGAFTKFLPDGVQYRGLEFNDAAVKAAQEMGLSVDKREVEQIASEYPNSYDVVCHFQVLEHVEDPLGFMQYSAAAVRPGGRMIVAVPAEDSFVGVAESAWLNMPPHHLTRWTDEALSNLLTKVGLRTIEIWHENVAPYHTEWQQRVLSMAGLRDAVGSKPQPVTARGFRLAERLLSKLPVVSTSLVNRGLAAHPFATRGHTVCAVASKHPV
jgi:2-polyprenyl-3-methyl-5-hydroxy-6-metoxy-1,4-benzoquinol methylase